MSCDGGSHGYGFVPVNRSVVVHVQQARDGGEQTREKLSSSENMLALLYCKHWPLTGQRGNYSYKLGGAGVDIRLPHDNERLEINLLTYPDKTGQKRSKRFRSKQVTSKVMATTTSTDESIVFLQQKITPTNHVGVFVDKATHGAENRLLFFHPSDICSAA